MQMCCFCETEVIAKSAWEIWYTRQPFLQHVILGLHCTGRLQA